MMYHFLALKKEDRADAQSPFTETIFLSDAIPQLEARHDTVWKVWNHSGLKSGGKVLFDTFSYNKKYYSAEII